MSEPRDLDSAKMVLSGQGSGGEELRVPHQRRVGEINDGKPDFAVR